ncbi:MAG: TIGR03618 family F420-dependent PPOX class oxidoreductase, partial [Myxococcota bacterium]
IWDPEQADFLASHKIAAFATGRRDGSPQLSHIVYDWDRRHIAISIKSHTAKWHNVRRQPRVALLVHDGRKQLVIYGRAEAIDADPPPAELAGRVFRRLTGDPDFDVTDEFVEPLDAQKRTVLRVVPETATLND